MWQRLWKIQEQKVAQKFKINCPGIDPKTKQRTHIQWTMNSDGDFIVKPTGVKFNFDTFDGWLKWHSSKNFYKDNGKPLDEHTDQAIVSFEVGTKNEGELVLTQQALINHSSSETEKILRSMQTGTCRLEQTFATFSEHPELLDSLSHQRLFELNLFKQGELLQKIIDQPSFAKELLAFAKNNFSLAYGTRNIPRALFFIQLNDLFRGYIGLSSLQNIVKTEILKYRPFFYRLSKTLRNCSH